MAGFTLQIATFILLLFTTYLSIQTQLFQVRTAIRESLEQIDDFQLEEDLKLKAILYRFSYRGRWSQSRIFIKWRTPGADASMSSNHEQVLYWLDQQGESDFIERLETENSVSDVKKTDHGMLFTIQSKDPVKVRQVVETVFEAIENSYATN
jgi:hypothetical protein